jgi:flagellar basal-body rod protein FlgB
MFSKLTSNYRVLEKALDAAWLRNEAISQNIANVDTPNYKKKTVAFEEYLNDAMDGKSFKGFTTDRRHIQIGGDSIDSVDIKITQDNKDTSYRLDGNNVDIESEMASQAKNDIKYNTLIQSLNTGYKRIKSVISEGRK